jgi:thioredoxin reductase
MEADRQSDPVDVAIVGGGPAGMSAALVLGRMRRTVVVFDTEEPANAVSHGVGGLLTRDGTPPAELRAIGREQIAKYPTVEFRRDEVTAARKTDAGFEVDAGGGTVTARRLLLAHGLDYGRPELEGLEQLWGERAFHCPYCHGWEVRDRHVAIVATTERALHQAALLRSLASTVTVVGADGVIPEPSQKVAGAAGAEIFGPAAVRVEADGDGVRIELEGGGEVGCDAVFIQPEFSLASHLAESLGAELAENGFVAAEAGETSVPGLHVAGDAAAGQPQAVAIAIGSGGAVAAQMNLALASEDVGAKLG